MDRQYKKLCELNTSKQKNGKKKKKKSNTTQAFNSIESPWSNIISNSQSILIE